MARVAHHSATTPQPENVDQGSRQDDQMGRSGGSQRSRCLHRLPQHQVWIRQASGTGNSSYGKKDSIQVRRVARALQILRVDLESAPSSCWGAPPSRNWIGHTWTFRGTGRIDRRSSDKFQCGDTIGITQPWTKSPKLPPRNTPPWFPADGSGYSWLPWSWPRLYGDCSFPSPPICSCRSWRRS